MFVFHKNLFSTFKNISTARLFHYTTAFTLRYIINLFPLSVFIFFFLTAYITWQKFITLAWSEKSSRLRGYWFKELRVIFWIPVLVSNYAFWIGYKKGSDSRKYWLFVVENREYMTRLHTVNQSKLFPGKFTSKYTKSSLINAVLLSRKRYLLNWYTKVRYQGSLVPELFFLSISFSLLFFCKYLDRYAV